jgi:hypothetical protein
MRKISSSVSISPGSASVSHLPLGPLNSIFAIQDFKVFMAVKIHYAVIRVTTPQVGNKTQLRALFLSSHLKM